MKLFLLAGVLSVSMVHVAHAQSLDIGGIELRLGQKVDEALRSLSSYQVQYSSGSWFVTQKIGNLYQFLGSIGATANVISFISKSFDMNENEDASEVYTRASKELRRRGGTICATREVEYKDGLIHGFETQCGPYRLSYYMPSKTADGAPVLGEVSISIRTQ
jgi:hypothetical protein